VAASVAALQASMIEQQKDQSINQSVDEIK
jgi:hypothetical protein